MLQKERLTLAGAPPSLHEEDDRICVTGTYPINNIGKSGELPAKVSGRSRN